MTTEELRDIHRNRSPARTVTELEGTAMAKFASKPQVAFSNLTRLRSFFPGPQRDRVVRRFPEMTLAELYNATDKAERGEASR
jgi:hypothetical protein